MCNAHPIYHSPLVLSDSNPDIASLYNLLKEWHVHPSNHHGNRLINYKYDVILPTFLICILTVLSLITHQL